LAGFFTAGFNDLVLSFGFGSVLRFWSPEYPASSGSIHASQKGYSPAELIFEASCTHRGQRSLTEEK
jgi:hypothetical protein